ncbi:uncharacterized protein LA080_003791 [Diaporthe eres]|uniref:Uncharacterized protein n=1 Tax=Diaporthe vaccinii TaxID=105482 RepID=A0ABR4FBA6_9PEZI|nr:uncharacterized protein LA080_003791 [Diaporthe eres]
MTSNRHPVQVFTDVPAELLHLLEARLPRSITLLRRLQFTNFPTGKTDSASIIVASDVPLHERHGDSVDVQNSTIRHFTAAYLDPSHGFETNMWLYSTFEDSNGAMPRQGRIYSTQPLAHPDHIFIGSLNKAVRDVALASGLRFGPTPKYECEKIILHIDELPPPRDPELPAGMVWGTGTVRDCELVKSRTNMPRSVHQEPFRRRDLAKTVSAKLIRDKTSAYGGDKFAAADVAPDNTSSQAMCKSLNGKVHWAGSW